METNPPLQSILITGASTGIGEACALYLDQRGVRQTADGERLKSQASDHLTPIFLDVTNEAIIAAAVKTVTQAVGETGLVGLVNNAGIVAPGPLEYLPIQDLRYQMEVNLVGQVAVTQAFLPLIRQGQGRIINMGSIGGVLATPFIGAYSASKFALEAITDSLRVELHPWHIPVVMIEPGSIITPIWDKGRDTRDQLLSQTPAQFADYYGAATQAMTEMAAETEKRGLPPQAVAEVVYQALTAETPQTRYVVGNDAKLQAILARFLPDRVRDKAIIKLMGLPGNTQIKWSDFPPSWLWGLVGGLILGKLILGRRR
jgi:NAD(P)-dependent dehydrogenase (short-subunit alcohol dehydrogenase family)